MMHTPSISFVLFAYNQADYVGAAVAGALAQDYPNLEIILSDDCSADATFDIMSSMARAYNGPHKIILNRNEQNRGVGAHVNKAFSLASGEWIVTGAGDDISDPGRCALVASLAASNSDALAIGLGWRDMDAAGNPCPGGMLRRYTANTRLSGADPTWIEVFKTGDFGVWGMTAAWHRDLIKAWPLLPDDVRQEDEIYSFRLALAGRSMLLDSTVAASYRHHESNASGYDNRVDLQTTEKRRVGRAAMNLKTWRFLHAELATLAVLPPGLPTEGHRRELLAILDRKIKACEDEASWWECGTFGRLRRSLFPAERQNIARWPREWARILPMDWYLRVKDKR